MSALKIYLEQVQAEKGLRRLNRLNSLRWYIKTTRTEDLIQAIRKITDINQLKILQEAGLPKAVGEAMARRVFELTERRK